VIAGKDHPLRLEGEGEVVAEVPRHMQGAQPPACSADLVAIGKPRIGDEAAVDPLAAAKRAAKRQHLAHGGAAAGVAVAEGQYRRAGCGGERAGERRVVEMAVGDEDMADALTGAESGKDGGQMRRIVGAGVDHGDFGSANEVGIGSRVRHRRGVRGTQPSDLLSQNLRFSHCLFLVCSPAATLSAMNFGWLKQYMPRGLYGRAALILIVPIVVTQIVVSISFVQRQFEGVTRQMVANVALEIGTIIHAADAADSAAAARAAARKVATPLAISVVLPAPVSARPDRRRYYDLSGRVVIASLRARIGGVRWVDLIGVPGAVRVGLQSRFGVMELQFARRLVSATNSHQLLVWLIFTGALMTLIAYLFLRNQLRPIRRLAVASEAFGRGQHLPYHPAGAIEVRAAGHAFLDMRARIERHIEQRTLLLSGVSHDLRTPLTRLKLALSMSPESDESAALLRDVEDMEHILDAFLDFARAEALAEPKPTDPVALARGVVEASRAGAGAVSFVVDIGAGAAQIVPLRATAIKRALENLLSNARRYGTHARVSVALSDARLKFCVEDDGPGIAPERRDEALRPFTRLDAARNQNLGSGVGLGMSIAADIARRHGGTLTLGRSADLGGLKAEIVVPF